MSCASWLRPAIRATATICALLPGHALAGPELATSYNSYGYPGLIDMPVAASRPDGEIALSYSSFAGQYRNTLTFQITPRLSGSFRYSVLENLTNGGTGTTYDRSFSLHFRFVDEYGLRPAIAVGLNDFLGTGIYSSEYVVATKSVGPRLRFSAGLGWGRLGTSNGFANPLSILGSRFETRPPRDVGKGGSVESAQFFRGDAALFGGLEWQATDRLRVTTEFSSDAYPRETPAAFRRRSQVNFGASYRIRPGTELSVRYLYGSEIGFQITTAFNPKLPPIAGREPAPPPVLPRKSTARLSWPVGTVREQAIRQRFAAALDAQGMRLHGFTLSRAHVRAEIENLTFPQEAQAIGRTARLLSRQMPARIGTFVIILVTGGVPVSELHIRRNDMEALEHELDGSWESFARAQITSATGSANPLPERYPRFDWSMKPYLSPSLFDPDNPVRADAGAELNFSFEPAAGLEFAGSIRKKIIGNLDDATRRSDSVLPRVRSDFALYDKAGDPAITNLTGAYYFKPGRDIYGRITAGYLERMFGGVSAELLWKRNGSPFALGVEANYTRQRSVDQLFGFRSYNVATGHLSAYWDIGNGFHAQIDAGRYLAGDWGATFAIDREFNNGWKIGAFATLTDVPFSTFGEGSFDKGIRITIPVSWLSGEPSKTGYSTTIRPLTRDGGARLGVNGRLYERIRHLQKPALQDGWGRFWR